MTTAQYRSQAWEEQEKGNHAGAAELYRKALETYPNHTGSLAQADRAKLAQQMAFNATMAR